MAITVTAPYTYAGGFVTGTNTTTIIRANADITGIYKGDIVYNTTRAKYSQITAISVGGTNTTITIFPAITSQTTTDTITFTPPVEVAAYKTNGTATSGTSTTLTDSGKAWTVNAYTGYIVWIISGTGAGATGVIQSNTATALTVDSFFKVNTSGTPITTITPDASSVYGVAWNYSDCVTALAANFAWVNTSTAKGITCNKGIMIKAGSALADYKKSITFTTSDTGIQNEAGSLYQSGRLTTDFTGIDGGYITFQKNQSGGYTEMYPLGLLKFYGCDIREDQSFLESTNALFRYNNAGTGGLHVLNSKISRVAFYMTTIDTFKDIETEGAVLVVISAPFVAKNIFIQEGSLELLGVAGGDFFDLKGRGTPPSTSLIQRPLSTYNSSVPTYVNYNWRADTGTFALSNCIDWYPGGTFAGVFYIGAVVEASTKTSAGSNLGTVAVGIIKTSDGTGQIVTAKQGSGANYAPTKARFITTDANGAYTGPFGASEGIFVLNSKLVYGGSRFVSTVNDYSGYTLVTNKYGYVQQVLSRVYPPSQRNTEVAYLTTDSFSVASYATAIAYTGITMTPATSTTGTITISGTRTIQELYDFVKARLEYEAKTNDVHVVDPFTTTNGVSYTLAAGWSISVTGNLSDATKSISGTLAVSGTGFYEDSTGAQWLTASVLYKASRFYTNVKDNGTSGNIPNAVVAYINSTGVGVTYNTSLVNGGILTDASGNAQGYAAYYIGGTTNNTITQFIGEYNYQWSQIPKSVSGAPIGSSGTYETVRLATDTRVVLTKANALAVSGITTNHSTWACNMANNTLSATYDNLKARQTTTAEIEAGLPGQKSYYQLTTYSDTGLIVRFDGTTYWGGYKWTFTNSGGGGTLKQRDASGAATTIVSATLNTLIYGSRCQVWNQTGASEASWLATHAYTTGMGMRMVPISVSSITRTGSIATVTTATAHGYTTGDYIKITGANQPDYNGRTNATVTGANTFTYPVGGSPATPATGTITTLDDAYWYECITAGTSAGTAPAWGKTIDGTFTDGGVTWKTRALEISNGLSTTTFGTSYEHKGTNRTLRFRVRNAEAVSLAGNFVVGTQYTITTVGTTDFTLVGAANNNVGTIFTATGVGAGTGTATATKIAYETQEFTGTITDTGFSQNVTQVLDTVYGSNNIDGSTVTECSMIETIVKIYVNAGSNSTTAQRIYNWYTYANQTVDGIRDQADNILPTDQTHYVFQSGIKIINQNTTNPLEITGANIVPTTGSATAVFDVTNGASMILNFNRVEAFTYSTGSGLSSAQDTTLTTINNKLGTPVATVSTDIAGVQTTTNTINTKIGVPITDVSIDISKKLSMGQFIALS